MIAPSCKGRGENWFVSLYLVFLLVNLVCVCVCVLDLFGQEKLLFSLMVTSSNKGIGFLLMYWFAEH